MSYKTAACLQLALWQTYALAKLYVRAGDREPEWKYHLNSETHDKAIFFKHIKQNLQNDKKHSSLLFNSCLAQPCCQDGDATIIWKPNYM